MLFASGTTASHADRNNNAALPLRHRQASHLTSAATDKVYHPLLCSATQFIVLLTSHPVVVISFNLFWSKRKLAPHLTSIHLIILWNVNNPLKFFSVIMIIIIIA